MDSELFDKASFLDLMCHAPGLASFAQPGMSPEEDQLALSFLERGWPIVVFFCEPDWDNAWHRGEESFCPTPYLTGALDAWAHRIYLFNTYPDPPEEFVRQVSLCCELAGRRCFPPATFPVTLDDAKLPRELFLYTGVVRE